MKNPDEDFGYEQQRQRRIDEMPPDEWRARIGSGLRTCDKVQRFAHHDPAPQIPFQEDLEPRPDPLAACCWAVIAIGLIACGYALWGMF